MLYAVKKMCFAANVKPNPSEGTNRRVDYLEASRFDALRLSQQLPPLRLEPAIDSLLKLLCLVSIQRIEEAKDVRPMFRAYPRQRLEDQPEILPAHLAPDRPDHRLLE